MTRESRVGAVVRSGRSPKPATIGLVLLLAGCNPFAPRELIYPDDPRYEELCVFEYHFEMEFEEWFRSIPDDDKLRCRPPAVVAVLTLDATTGGS